MNDLELIVRDSLRFGVTQRDAEMRRAEPDSGRAYAAAMFWSGYLAGLRMVEHELRIAQTKAGEQ
jgi:hypothetical protein